MKSETTKALEQANSVYDRAEPIAVEGYKVLAAVDSNGGPVILYRYKWPANEFSPTGMRWFIGVLIKQGPVYARTWLTDSLWRSGGDIPLERYKSMMEYADLIIEPYGKLGELLDEFWPTWEEVNEHAHQVSVTDEWADKRMAEMPYWEKRND